MNKKELLFAISLFMSYMIGNSLGGVISNAIGIKNCATVIFNIGMSLFLFFWIKQNGLLERYGLQKPELPVSRFLWYIPLIILASRNLWNGVAVNFPIIDTIFSVCNMIGVGFLEEILFRGFLFRAISRNNAKIGIVFSSVSFGLVHLVNLTNSRGMEFAENMRQIIFAVTFGVLFVIIFYQGKTLWPCILTHTIINITSIFAKEMEPTDPIQIFQDTFFFSLLVGYTYIMTKVLPEGKA